MGSSTQNLAGGVSGVLAGRQRALTTPAGQGGPQINDLVGQVGRNLQSQNAALAAPGAGNVNAATEPLRIGNTIGGVNNLLTARNMAMGGMPGQGATPDISYLVGNVRHNMVNNQMASEADPNNPAQRATLMALNSPNASNTYGAPNISDLIRMVRQVRGLG